jgi:uncharacterized protein YdeI (YjbR/CyaY-like superfamily)
MKSRAPTPGAARLFKQKEAWAAWLDEQHSKSSGIWLRLAKKASGVKSVSEALEVALCYGWIDGQKRSESENTWLQKFAPRTRRSIWSKINRQKAVALIRSGQMNPAGLKEIERAKRDGRWAAAYDSPRTATVPSDFQAALDRNPRAKAFFAALDTRNRYAVLFRIHSAKKAETRTARIRRFIAMLEAGQKLHS